MKVILWLIYNSHYTILLSGPIVAQIEPNIVLALSKTGRVRAAEPATLQN